MTVKSAFAVDLGILARTSTCSPITTPSHNSRMASLESRLCEKIREAESLPPLGVSLTQFAYNADDRRQWRKQGKVTWEGAVEGAAVDDEYNDVQKSVKVKIGRALVMPAVRDAMWDRVRHRDVQKQAHDLYEILGFVLMQECGEARTAWVEDEGSEAEKWADAVAKALWQMSLQLIRREGDSIEDATALPTTEAAGPSSYSTLSDLVARVQQYEDNFNRPDMRHIVNAANSMAGLGDFIPNIRT